MNEGDTVLNTEEYDRDGLGKALETDLSMLDELGRRDLLNRLKAADAVGVASLLGLDRKKGLELIRRLGEAKGRVAERAALRTPDARKLGKELLSLFSDHASGELAKARFLVTTPTLDPGLIQARLSLCSAARGMYDSLGAKGKLEGSSKLLKEAAFEKAKQGGTGVSAYFAARGRFLKIATSLFDGFGDIAELKAFLSPIDHAELAALSRTMEEMSGGALGDAEAVLGDAEVMINEELRKGRADAESARRTVEGRVEDVVSALGMNASEEEGLRRSAMEGLRIPFEFEKGTLNDVLRQWRRRQEEERARRTARLEASLRQHLDLIDLVVAKLLELDRALAIAAAMSRYSLTVPELGGQGEGFVDGRNLFLLRDSPAGREGEVLPVSYSLGKPQSIKVAKARNVAVLTGANSGGKTTLLTTLASIHILTLYGLPVPCARSEVVPVPIYLFRRRVTRRIGSLEHALGSLIPVFGDRRRKLVLIDEFEALTEPGAAGRIMAAVLNEAASGSSLVLVVTHLARETLPHVRLPIRVDGIEAKGLDSKGDLLVNRQPVFGHIGSSMPKLIIMKLARSTKNRRVKALYEEILSSIKEEKAQVQAPIATPWAREEE
jgi:DNA mismatch repair protein MutS2